MYNIPVNYTSQREQGLRIWTKKYYIWRYNMGSKKFTLNEIILEAMDFYETSEYYRLYNKNHKSIVLDQFRKKFDSFVKNTLEDNGKTFWDNALDYDYKGANKKSFHFFTTDQKNKIISADEIHDYMINLSSNPEIKNRSKRSEINKIVKESHKNWQEVVKELGLANDHYIGITPSETDFNQLKTTIMFEALFNLFFEPLDQKKLSEDFYNSCLYGGNTETFESAYSKLRLRDYTNYYTPKKNIDSTMDKLLDVLADKITSKLGKSNKMKF